MADRGIKRVIQDVLLTNRRSEYLKELQRAEKRYDEYVRQVEEAHHMMSRSELTYHYAGAEELLEIGLMGLESSKGGIMSEGITPKDNIIQIGIPDIFVIHLDEGVVAEDGIGNILSYFESNRDINIIYGDEDCFGATADEFEEYKIKGIPASRRFWPYIKPVPTFETFLSKQYMGCLLAFRKSVFENGRDTQFGEILARYGYDNHSVLSREDSEKIFYLFLMYMYNNGIGHIEKVLFHRFIEMEKGDITLLKNGRNIDKLISKYPEIDGVKCGGEESVQIKDDFLRLNGIKGHMELRNDYYCPVYDIEDEEGKSPLVSIIIPSKDNVEVLKLCINSIRVHTSYSNYEVIVVDNGSSDDNKNELEIYFENLSASGFDVQYIYQREEFNYSYMNNLGVAGAAGEYILLLNDDVTVVHPDWLGVMLGQAMQEGVGCVGAKLLYPDNDRIQHIGITNTATEPVHLFLGKSDSKVYYHGRNRLVLNCLAVTGACLMVKKSLYDSVGGLNENLAVAYNDVDFCFNMIDKGLRNVIRNDVTLIHHESLSRGKDAESEEKLNRLKNERQHLYLRHTNLYGKDPFEGNENVTKTDFGFDIENDYYSNNHVAPKVTNKNYSQYPQGVHVVFEKLERDSYKRLDGRNVYLIQGFCIVPVIDNLRFTYEMVFEGDKVNYVMPMKGYLRLDLDRMFPDTMNTKLSGFNNYVLQSEMEPGNYKIGIYAVDHGNYSRKYYEPTGKIIYIE